MRSLLEKKTKHNCAYHWMAGVQWEGQGFTSKMNCSSNVIAKHARLRLMK